MKTSILIILIAPLLGCTATRRPIAGEPYPVSYPRAEPILTEPSSAEERAPAFSLQRQPIPSPASPRTSQPVLQPSVPRRYGYVPGFPDYDHNLSGDRDEVRRQADDLSWEIRRLRRNNEDYDSDEFRRRLRRLEFDADTLATSADDAGVDTSAAEELSHNFRKLRRDIDFEPSSYYRNRNYDIDRNLKNYENDLEDYSNALDE